MLAYAVSVRCGLHIVGGTAGVQIVGCEAGKCARIGGCGRRGCYVSLRVDASQKPWAKSLPGLARQRRGLVHAALMQCLSKLDQQRQQALKGHGAHRRIRRRLLADRNKGA